MKHGDAKVVTAVGYEFDCIPGFAQITGRGQGSTLRVAAARAVENVLTSQQLKGKRLGRCKIAIVVEQKGGA